MKLTKTTWFRAGRWIGMFLIGLAWAWLACAQTISTTTVQGTVYLANGAPGSGTLQLSWPAFTTASGDAVAAGRTTATIGSDGFVSVNLVPNLGSSPAGLFYTAVYNMSDGTTSTEYWVVPAAAQATIAQVRAQVMPAAQAVQAVTKSYVDQAIQTATTSLSPSGGTLTSPLYLSGDPTQPLQAADKHYVDSSFALALPLSGGTLTGPGYAASDPSGSTTTRLQFATQHYADTSQRYNVKDAGAVGDGRAGTVTTSTASGITTLTCNACSFTAADAGKTINIPGAGATYLQGGTLGTATVTINTSGVVTAVSLSGYSGLPASATIPVTFSSAGASPAVTAKGYITTSSSGVPTMHIWVGGMDYASAPTISAGWAKDGSTVLPGAGLKTTIASVVDSTHVTLATAATTDVTTGVKAYYGTDDTSALNSAMQTVLSQPIAWTNGGQQFFLPCGTYLISGALTVNNSSAVPTGFRILGSSMGCAKLVQLTDNTPILNFTQGGAWGFQVSDLSFDYANYQPPSFANSVGVYFNASGSGNNFYTWDMSRLMFYGGFRGIGIGNANQAVWGYTIDRVTGGGGLSGATLYLSNAGGDPRIQLRHIYNTQTVGEPVISTGVAGSVTASSIEADNAYGTVFSLLGNHLQLNDAECELCYRAATGQYFVVAYASDVNVRGSDDHAIPPNIGSPISVIEYQTTSAPTLVAGSVDIQQSVVKVDPCYGITSGCTPPSHYAYIGQDNQLTAQTFKGNFVFAASPEVFSGSGMLRTSSNSLLYGSVTQQNLATSDGYFQVQNAASPYQFDASQSVYESLNIPANLSSGNFSFLNGWQGAKMRVRLVQPPQGSGPYTVSAPGNVLGFVAPPLTNGFGGTGTGATCTATIGSGTVTGVTCSGGTGYPASTQIRLQFTGGTSTASNVPVVPPAAYITTDASGNLTGSATMSTNGANYATAPAVGVGMAYSEQTFVFDQELSKWVPSGPAILFDGINLTTQQASGLVAPAVSVTNRVFDCGSPAYTSLNACLDAAKTYVGNTNAGTDKAVDIKIPQGTFSLTAPYTLVGGMHLLGVMPRLETNANYLYNTPNGGTWINCGGAASCFTGNSVNGIQLEKIGFLNFTYAAVTFGGNNLAGLTTATMKNLRIIGGATVNSSDKGIELYNSQEVTMDSIYVTNVNTGLRFVSQSTTISPGNSLIKDFFVTTYPKSAANANNTLAKAGISLEGLDTGSGGKNLLYLTFIKPQINSYGSDGTGYDFVVNGVATSGVDNLNIIAADLEGNTSTAFYADYLGNSVLIAAGNTGETSGVVLTANDTNNQFLGSWGGSTTPWTDPVPANGNVLWAKLVQGAPEFDSGLSTGNYSGAILNLNNQTASQTIANFGSTTQHCYAQNEGAVGARTAIACTNNITLEPYDGTVKSQSLSAAGTTNVSGCSLTGAAGGAYAGKFTSGTTGTCTVTITLQHSATNGNTCWANDLTTTSDKLVQTAGGAGTSATISGTTASGDVINWGCIAF